MSEDNKTPEEKPPQWQYKEDFAINAKLKEVIERTAEATTAEIDNLKRKLEKLTYGA